MLHVRQYKSISTAKSPHASHESISNDKSEKIKHQYDFKLYDECKVFIIRFIFLNVYIVSIKTKHTVAAAMLLNVFFLFVMFIGMK